MIADLIASAHSAQCGGYGGLGPRTPEQLEDLLGGAGITLSDDVLDQIDAIVPPGADVGELQMGYHPSVLTTPHLRRRPAAERPAA